MPYRDIEKQREANRRYYERNLDKFAARRKRRLQEEREILIEAKAHPCVDCGGTYPPYVMEFHHRDSTGKVDNVGTLVGRGKPQLLAEIEKCDLLCANCHRIRTYSLVV